jgi:lysophospholipase L1-like esterase
MTIVRVTSGGIPVTESATGYPYYEADNGFGIPVTFGSTGIPLGRAGTSTPPATLSARFVGYRGQVPNLSLLATTSANNKRTYRIRERIQVDCDELQIGFGGYYINGAEVDYTSPQTIEAAVEIGGTTVAWTFSAASTGTIPGPSSLYLSDKLMASQFGLTKFAENTPLWIRFNIEVTATTSIMQGTTGGASIIDNSGLGESGVSMASGVASQVTGNGPLTTGGSYATITTIRYPLCLIGKPLVDKASMLGVGDSIMRGVGDNGGDGYVNGGGYPLRAIAKAKKLRGYAHVPSTGSAIDQWGTTKAAIAASRRAALFPYAQWLLCQYGHNGLGNLGGSAALGLTYARNVWQAFKDAQPTGKVFQTTITVDSAPVPVLSLTSVSTTATVQIADTSLMTTGDSVVIAGATPAAYNGTYAITVVDATHVSYTFAGGTSPATGAVITMGDNWKTANYQVPSPNFELGGLRDQLNALYVAEGTSNGLTACFDVAPTSADGSHANLWWSNGVANAVVFDGTHPAPLGTQVIAWQAASQSLVSYLDAQDTTPSRPTPSFGSTALIAWQDISTVGYQTKDLTGTASFYELKDMSGARFDFQQPTKSRQPTVGTFGGAFFPAAAGACMDSVQLNMLNGLQKLTVGISFALSSTYTGTALRTLLDISNAANNQDRFRINVTGSTGRLLQVVTRQQDVGNRSSSGGTALTQDVKHYAVVVLDMSGASATLNVYIDGTLAYSDTWTPTDASPWAFINAPGAVIRLGNNKDTVTDVPLVGEVRGLVVIGDAVDATRRGLIETYLNAI